MTDELGVYRYTSEEFDELCFEFGMDLCPRIPKPELTAV